MKTLLADTPWSRRLTAGIDRIAILCGWWLIVLSVATCVEMLGRKLGGFSLQGIDEIGGYTYAILGAFGFAYTLVTRGHTRVDFLMTRFPVKVQAVLNLLAMLSLTAMVGLCVWRGGHVLADTIDLHSTASTPLATPLWMPQALWLAGYALFALVAASAAWHALQLLVRRDWVRLNSQFGPQTLAEEIEAEADIRVATAPPGAAATGQDKAGGKSEGVAA
ncbi:TRAP transporter small permease subunit [Cupriavidus sp. NPDC089707]|uniref:TRAP transporter small permease subunit n=1 Tax=Cupriavidus sp. NPDC089707 TaxID=3363963 RepID=UPI00380A50A5